MDRPFFEPAPRRGNKITYKPSEIDKTVTPEKLKYRDGVPIISPGGGKTRLRKHRSTKRRKTRRKRNKRSKNPLSSFGQFII